MLTTSTAGRTWNFSHAIGRVGNAGAAFFGPVSVAAGADGILYVLNRGHAGGDIGVTGQNQRISKLTIDEEFQTEFARLEFEWPVSLALDRDGNVYCSDEALHFIGIYDPDGQRIGQWGESGSEPGQLKGPSGIAFDSNDDLYVSDSLNNRVQKFTKDGTFLLEWGVEGSAPGEFSRPWGLTVDANDDLYVADWGNDRVQKFSSNGTHLRTFGRTGNNGTSTVSRPSDVAVDSEGDVYVADWGNKLVRIFTPDAEPLAQLVGDAEQFSKWAKEVVESNPDALKAYRRCPDMTPLYRFDRPTGITIDDQDRIIVTDSNRGRLQVYLKEKDYMDPQFNL